MNKKALLGAILNFFLLGPGYLFFTKRTFLGLFLSLGAIVATYLEQVLLKNLEDQTPFKFMFVAFFLLALGCAIDGYKEISDPSQKC